MNLLRKLWRWFRRRRKKVYFVKRMPIGFERRGE